GSGFAGTHLALQALRAGHRVAVVEAGAKRDAKPREIIIEDSFEFRNEGEVAWPVNSGRAIAVGGTSNKWAGVVNRLRPTDFEMQSRFGLAVDWPIGYDDLDDYYCRSEKLLAVRGYPVRAGEPPRGCQYEQLESDYRSPDAFFDIKDPEFFGVARSRREDEPVRLVKQEIPALESMPKATLFTETQVTRLVSGDGASIDHLRAVGPDGSQIEIRARVFVVAAGAVETPRLLLVSTCDRFPGGVGNDRDLVGRFFSVHPITSTLVPRSEPLGISSGPHRTYALTEPLRRQGLRGCSFQVKEIAKRGLEWKMQPEIEPRSENRVKLSATELDAHGNPLPVVELNYSQDDRRLFAECEQILLDQGQRLSQAIEPLQPRSGWRYHPSGACRMGADDSGGVVDPSCRVFGTDNLYIAGASIFPTAGTSNPTLTVVALTLRLADHLLERAVEWGRSRASTAGPVRDGYC
ncbi:MAG: GMC family oxidoreductase, partial [Acidobacteriota bacterium]